MNRFCHGLLGVLPKNLGNSTVTNFQFSSSIGIMPEDMRDRRSVGMFTAPGRAIDGEIVE